MHIMCIHMAMVAMRIAVNIVLCFYRTRPRPVKAAAQINSASGLPALEFPARLPIKPFGDRAMKTCCILVLLCCAIPALALSGNMEKATVHSMRKVPCAEAQTSGRGGFFSGLANSGVGMPGECVEYELHTAKVVYIIRPNRNILLLLGGDVSIKLAGDELLMRTPDAPKDVRCSVVGMSLLTDVNKSELTRTRVCLNEDGREITCPWQATAYH
jgi:hypothetical protein